MKANESLCIGYKRQGRCVVCMCSCIYLISYTLMLAIMLFSQMKTMHGKLVRKQTFVWNGKCD